MRRISIYPAEKIIKGYYILYHKFACMQTWYIVVEKAILRIREKLFIQPMAIHYIRMCGPEINIQEATLVRFHFISIQYSIDGALLVARWLYV